MYCFSIILIVAWILYDDEAVLFIWRNHYLVLLGADSDEGNLLVFVDGLDGKRYVSCELADKWAIFDGVRVGHRCLDGYALWVDYHAAFDALMGVDAVQGVLYFLRHYGSYKEF